MGGGCPESWNIQISVAVICELGPYGRQVAEAFLFVVTCTIFWMWQNGENSLEVAILYLVYRVKALPIVESDLGIPQ